MTNDLTYLKIKVALAKLNMNEKYIGYEYLARVLLIMVGGENDVQCYKTAVNSVSEDFNISQSYTKMSINGVLKNSKFFDMFPKLANHSTCKKLSALKLYINEQLA